VLRCASSIDQPSLDKTDLVKRRSWTEEEEGTDRSKRQKKEMMWRDEDGDVVEV
jgi:hypothetical protein